MLIQSLATQQMSSLYSCASVIGGIREGIGQIKQWTIIEAAEPFLTFMLAKYFENQAAVGRHCDVYVSDSPKF
jgi:hypothetical protein